MRPHSQSPDQSPNLPTPVGVKEGSQALKCLESQPAPEQTRTPEQIRTNPNAAESSSPVSGELA